MIYYFSITMTISFFSALMLFKTEPIKDRLLGALFLGICGAYVWPIVMTFAIICSIKEIEK